ncbi:uncharacterized protein [Pyrus communis]|uniref:uncharacterized protein n=1 Tax=Pyrus communis TaxID=23211 RepID=UPI0035C0D1D9
MGANGSDSMSNDGRSKVLRKIWNACVPGKVRICAWRACMNGLPTHANLARRMVAVENVCSICGGNSESTEHVLRDSSLAKTVWFGGLGIRVDDSNHTRFISWITSVAMQSSSMVFDLCLMTLWRLWKNRNDVLWNGKQVRAKDLVLEADDPAKFEGEFGVIIRDHQGIFVAAGAGLIGPTGSAFHAELFAARQALMLAQSFCPVGARMVFEGDASNGFGCHAEAGGGLLSSRAYH